MNPQGDKMERNERIASDYEILTHKGRRICERFELNGGYCGSVSLEGHISQMKDKNSWVHSSLKTWEEAGKLGFSPQDNRSKISYLESQLSESQAETKRAEDEILAWEETVKDLQSHLAIAKEELKQIGVFVTHAETPDCNEGRCSGCKQLDIIDKALESIKGE